MKVKDLMTSSLAFVRPEASIEQVAKQMKTDDIGSIPVCNDNTEPIGIITDRDIVLRTMADEQKPTTAKEIMSTNLVTATPDMSAHELSLLFAKNQIRRMPVVDNNMLVGMVSLADVARQKFYIDEAGDALNAISKQNFIS